MYHQMGGDAFRAGDSSTPAHNKKLANHLKTIPGSQIYNALKHWTKGWHKANLKS